MTITQLIAKLEARLAAHGDAQVVLYQDANYKTDALSDIDGVYYIYPEDLTGNCFDEFKNPNGLVILKPEEPVREA